MHMIHQVMNGTGNRVWHFIGNTVGIEADLFRHAATLLISHRTRLAHNTPRNTDHGSPFRHFFGYYCIGTDTGVVAHHDRPQHFGTSTHHHTIFQGWMALAFIPGGTTQRHTMVQGAVVTDFRRFPDHHAHAMVDKKAPANGGTGVNLNAGHPAAESRQYARQ